MKLFAVLTFSLLCCFAQAKETVFIGCTPVDMPVREFLDINRTDSLDFIRWKLVLKDNQFELQCSYGLSRPNTNGFMVEKRVAFSGSLAHQNPYIELSHNQQKFYLLRINQNLVHLLDKNKIPMAGDGGFAYTLTNDRPVSTGKIDVPARKPSLPRFMCYQGRTPCQPYSDLVGRNSASCIKLKWYMILYTDLATGKPSYYLQGGRQYKKETMQKGNWDMVSTKDGRALYRLNPEKNKQATHLLPLGDTILLFTDADGNPLNGSADFSFTLSRTIDREPSK